MSPWHFPFSLLRCPIGPHSNHLSQSLPFPLLFELLIFSLKSPTNVCSFDKPIRPRPRTQFPLSSSPLLDHSAWSTVAPWLGASGVSVLSLSFLSTVFKWQPQTPCLLCFPQMHLLFWGGHGTLCSPGYLWTCYINADDLKFLILPAPLGLRAYTTVLSFMTCWGNRLWASIVGLTYVSLCWSEL